MFKIFIDNFLAFQAVSYYLFHLSQYCCIPQTNLVFESFKKIITKIKTAGFVKLNSKRSTSTANIHIKFGNPF